MPDWLAYGFPELLARFAGWLRRTVDRLPGRTFDEASPADKAGRVLMMIAALALIVGPLLWWWLG